MSAPAPDVLQRIAERRRASLPEPGSAGRGPVRHARWTAAESPFLAALEGAAAAGRRAVIAEVKMGSPRLGRLVGRLDPLAQARLYRRHGAAALSVVVEPEFFHGSYELLAACREASELPTLAKDFVVDAVQLEWARAAGADAALLIAALHEAEELRWLAGRARGLGLVPLVEVHGEDDLAKLAGADWELIGVNNRDLRTFEVNLGRSVALASRLPAGALPIAESGISDGGEVARLAAAGFRGFLVGESLLLADDPAARLRELTG